LQLRRSPVWPQCRPLLRKKSFAYLEEPPFAETVDGHAEGTDIDVAKAVLGKMSIKDFEFKKAGLADLMPGVAAGHWTMTAGLSLHLNVTSLTRTRSGRWSTA
jgi:hypothetical protein